MGSCYPSERRGEPTPLSAAFATIRPSTPIRRLENYSIDQVFLHNEAKARGKSGAKSSLRKSGTSKHSRGSISSPTHFPEKLHEMLSCAERHGFDHIVSWRSHGRCFVVENPREFVSKILPLWFEHQSKLASFQRQLKNYGFSRLNIGPDRGGYVPLDFEFTYNTFTFHSLRQLFLVAY